MSDEWANRLRRAIQREIDCRPELQAATIRAKDRFDKFVAVLDGGQMPVDPRGPDHSREGVFVYHNCSRCQGGEKPCVKGNPRQCDWLHARND